MKKNYVWPVNVYAKTIDSDLKVKIMNRTEEGDGLEPLEIVIKAINKRKDKGIPFFGESVHVTTNLGQISEVYLDPDKEYNEHKE